jgi:hypothetical protein
MSLASAIRQNDAKVSSALIAASIPIVVAIAPNTAPTTVPRHDLKRSQPVCASKSGWRTPRSSSV